MTQRSSHLAVCLPLSRHSSLSLDESWYLPREKLVLSLRLESSEAMNARSLAGREQHAYTSVALLVGYFVDLMRIIASMGCQFTNGVLLESPQAYILCYIETMCCQPPGIRTSLPLVHRKRSQELHEHLS